MWRGRFSRRRSGESRSSLADLRLLHRFGSLSVQTGTYRGRRFIGYTLDLSNYTGTRSERIAQIEFWTPTGKQQARRASLIYEPGASKRTPAKKAAAATGEDALFEAEASDEQLPGDWTQTTIPDFPSDVGPVAAAISRSPRRASWALAV